MDSFMLEGWTPILLIGIGFVLAMFLVSQKVLKKTLLLISSVLSLVCLVVFIYSIVGIGGWEGMGVGIVTISVLLGIWIGTIVGVINKK